MVGGEQTANVYYGDWLLVNVMVIYIDYRNAWVNARSDSGRGGEMA
jgi:hypothetical protein